MNARAFAAIVAGTFLAGCATDVTLIPGTRPQRVTAVSGVSDVTLFWESVPGASGYRVYSGRKFEDSSSVTPLPPVGPDDFAARGGVEIETEDTRLIGMSFPDGDPLVPASFTVVALRGNGVSAPSDEVISHTVHFSPAIVSVPFFTKVIESFSTKPREKASLAGISM